GAGDDQPAQVDCAGDGADERAGDARVRGVDRGIGRRPGAAVGAGGEGHPGDQERGAGRRPASRARTRHTAQASPSQASSDGPPAPAAVPGPRPVPAATSPGAGTSCGWPAAQTWRSTSRRVSGCWAPGTAYVRSGTKKGTAETLNYRARASAPRTSSA